MKCILLCFLILPNIIFSQVSIDFGVKYTDTIPTQFKTSIIELQNSIYSQISSYSKSDKYEKVAYKFSDYAAHS